MRLDVPTALAHVILNAPSKSIECLPQCDIRIFVGAIGSRCVSSLDFSAVHRQMHMHVEAVSLMMAVLD